MGKHMEGIFQDIRNERLRQDKKFGPDRDQDAYRWFTILAEEHGEAAQAILEVEFGEGNVLHLREELVQIAAVSIAFIECLDRNRGVLLPSKKPARFHAYEEADEG